MATACVAVVGEEVCLGPEVTMWATRVSCTHSSDNVGHKDRPTAFPTSLVSEVAPAPPLVSPHLPMWEPARPVWPPSRSVFQGKGAGEARFSSGVRSTGLQGRWARVTTIMVRDMDLAAHNAVETADWNLWRTPLSGGNSR